MKHILETKLSLPSIGLIGLTRGMLGAGLGLLLGDRLGADQKRAVGWTLFAVGAVTTIPLIAEVFSHRVKSDKPEIELASSQMGEQAQA